MEENLTLTVSPSVSQVNGNNEDKSNWTSDLPSSHLVKVDKDNNEEIVRLIQVIGRPPIIILGTVGNLLTFFTMQRGSLKNLSTCFYMAILALADTGEAHYLLMIFK